MPSSSVRTFTDPDEYAAAVRQGTVNVTVTERGRFNAKICRVDFHELWMQRLSEDLAKTSHVAEWGARAILVFPTQPGAPIVRGGTELPWGSFARISAGKSYYQHSLGSTSFGGMSLPSEVMAAVGESMIGQDLTPPTDDLTVLPSAEAMARLQRLHTTAGHLAEDAPAVLAHPEAARGLEQALIEAMMVCLGGAETDEDRAAVRQHAVIMRRFHDAIERHLDEPLYISELCKAIGTSLRTLNACCHEHLGMGPKRFLLLRRMNLLRRALGENSRTKTTVTETATRYGFWQFGRLAVEYKALFGETPSATLARPA
jgi:AraC-like DNA-binding protein